LIFDVIFAVVFVGAMVVLGSYCERRFRSLEARATQAEEWSQTASESVNAIRSLAQDTRSELNVLKVANGLAKEIDTARGGGSHA
jgi:hypothetical protein